MNKLRLNLEEVKVESFEIEGISLSGRGTVRGRQDCQEGGDARFDAPGDEEAGGCSCRCCACSCPCCCKCNCCGAQ